MALARLVSVLRGRLAKALPAPAAGDPSPREQELAEELAKAQAQIEVLVQAGANGGAEAVAAELEAQTELAAAMEEELADAQAELAKLREQAQRGLGHAAALVAESARLQQQLAEREAQTGQLRRVQADLQAQVREREALCGELKAARGRSEQQGEALWQQLTELRQVHTGCGMRLLEEVRGAEQQRLRHAAERRGEAALREENRALLERLGKLEKATDAARRRVARRETDIEVLQKSNRKLRRIQLRGGVDARDLQTELELLKHRLQCGVCSVRDKSVILQRCSHMFCKECIDTNFKSRNRKCPACGERFGHDDMKEVFLQ